MTLAATRHELVERVEGLYKASPGLRSGLKNASDDDSEETVDVVLEGALLSLGRCLDIIRPGGMHTGSVSKSEYKRALLALDRYMVQMRSYCDPDRPIAVSEWGSFGPDGVDTNLAQADDDEEDEDDDDHEDTPADSINHDDVVSDDHVRNDDDDDDDDDN